MLLSDKLKKFRSHMNWTQTELAKRCDLTASAISQIENGDRYITIKSANKLATVMGISVAQLTGEQAIESNEEIKDFYNQWSEIKQLNSIDKKLLLEIIRRLK